MFVPAHAVISRHGIFYFRFVVPADIRPIVGFAEIKRSLNTRDPYEARISAQVLSLRMRLLVQHARSLMTYDPTRFNPSDPSTWPSAKKDIRDLSAKIPTPYGMAEFEVDSNNPADVSLYEKSLQRLTEFNHQLPTISPATTNKPTPANSDETMVSALVQKYLDEKHRVWPMSTYIEYKEYFNVFLEAMGDMAISSLDRLVMSSYKQDFLNLIPPNRKKKIIFRNKTLKQVIAEQKKTPIESRKVLAAKTVECYMTAVHTFLTWCVDNGKLTTNPATGLCSIKTKSGATAVKRHPFNQRELQTIFDSFRFSLLKEPALFWVPILALFTGARLNELCGLTTDDIRKVHDIDGKHPNLWEININEDYEDEENGEGRRVKNESAKRRVPIHPELIRIGFLSFVDDVKASGNLRLFPNLSKGRRGYGRKVSDWFSKYLTELGIKRAGKVFHCFRHTVISTLNKRGVRDSDYKLIVGHENKNSSTPYISDYELIDLYDNAYDKFEFHGLDLNQVIYSKMQFSGKTDE